MSQLNAALERKNASERKINSTKKYNRASEDPISAAKALRTRKAIANTEDYLSNLETGRILPQTIHFRVSSTGVVIGLLFSIF